MTTELWLLLASVILGLVIIAACSWIYSFHMVTPDHQQPGQAGRSPSGFALPVLFHGYQ